jgi:hypothetical protein
MSTRIWSVTKDISKKEKKSLRSIKERQVERPEHATSLLKWNAVGQGHEPEIDKLSHHTHAACQQMPKYMKRKVDDEPAQQAISSSWPTTPDDRRPRIWHGCVSRRDLP